MKTINTEIIKTGPTSELQISPSYDGLFFEIIDGDLDLFIIVPDSQLDLLQEKITYLRELKKKAR